MPQLLGDVRGEGCEHNQQRLQHSALAAAQCGEFVQADHEGAHGGVVREVFNVVRHLLDQLVERLQLVGRRLVVDDAPRAVRAGVIGGPELLQEAEDAVDAVRIPRLGLLQGAEEHLIEAKRVGAILLDDRVRIDDVVHRLRHLLHRPSAEVSPILEHELSVAILRIPSAEGVQIEDVVADDVHIHVDRRHVIVALQAVRHEAVRAHDAIDEVRSALDHALVDQLVEGLFLARGANVEEELVPEAAIDQVTRGMLRAADVKVHVAPIGVGFGRDECAVVVRIHVAQVVG